MAEATKTTCRALTFVFHLWESMVIALLSWWQSYFTPIIWNAPQHSPSSSTRNPFSSACHFSAFQIKEAFAKKNYLLHIYYMVMWSLISLQHREEMLQERLQNNNLGSWNNHSAVSCSPLGLPTRSHLLEGGITEDCLLILLPVT